MSNYILANDLPFDEIETENEEEFLIKKLYDEIWVTYSELKAENFDKNTPIDKIKSDLVLFFADILDKGNKKAFEALNMALGFLTKDDFMLSLDYFNAINWLFDLDSETVAGNIVIKKDTLEKLFDYDFMFTLKRALKQKYSIKDQIFNPNNILQ